MPLTLTVWIEALNHERSWDRARDEQRVKDAFSTLCRTVTQWPQPQHLMTALPPVTQQALTQKPIPADPARVAAIVAELEAELRKPARTIVDDQRAVQREKPDTAAVEEELRRHYADVKTRAAGDAE